MDASGELSGRERAERRLAVIYGELRELVQPTGALNDAPLARSEELEREAADLRQRWDLIDPRDIRRDPPSPVAKFLRRQWAYYAGPPFSMAVMLAIVWLALGVVWLVSAMGDGAVMHVALAVGGLLLGGAWGVTVVGAIAHRRRLARQPRESGARTDSGES
ncbi:hypothetical protein C1N74_06415 [Microbacterium sp. SGAir0570]|uniref:hypothetical protein n=1 Tax=Microbacterium sp. SGAir0570 TaxID=2070348 RepID=UPI0010CD3C11|nr:hypothetical protein [Microbacterium sp. SGAir0570]QCR40093.1 hypothetical protein C1N74_06415 [Microbacterium sp. SGAir0570]